MPTSPLWIDLTVEDADNLRDFYSDVIGWESEGVAMDGYEDYMMLENHESKAGICHARGTNSGLPPVWIPYFEVDSLETSLLTCVNKGGKMVTAIKSIDENRHYAVIQDPSGAVCAIWSEKTIS